VISQSPYRDIDFISIYCAALVPSMGLLLSAHPHTPFQEYILEIYLLGFTFIQCFEKNKTKQKNSQTSEY